MCLSQPQVTGESASSSESASPMQCSWSKVVPGASQLLLQTEPVVREQLSADGKTIYDLSRTQYDNEALTLRQMKHVTGKKIDMDNLLPQTLKCRLLIPDYDSGENYDKDEVNKKYADRKTFT